MSWQATAWSARQATGTTGAKCLLLLIANHASPSGVCFPGRHALAAECECRPETITANLARLEKVKLIWRHQRRRANGSRTSDWIVLGPLAKNRGEMVNADPEEYPHYIAEMARRGSGEDFSPESDRSGQVSSTGSPEVVREQARHISPRWRISKKKVEPEAWEKTLDALAFYNEQTGSRLSALDGRGEPSEVGKRVYLRVVAYPELDLDAHKDIIRRTLASRWWDKGKKGGPPSIGAVYGPKIFEENMTRQPTEKQAKESEAERLDAEELAAMRRLVERRQAA